MAGLGKPIKLDLTICSVALCHHGPPESEQNHIVTLSNWPHVSKFSQTNEIRLFIHGHGHQRKALRQNLTNGTISTKKGLLTKNEVLRVMGPTTHLKQELQSDQT